MIKPQPDVPSARTITDLMQTGLAWAKKGALVQAIQSFQAILKIDPGNAQACYNLGLAHKQAGDIDKAIGCYQMAARLAPADADIFFNWGNTLLAAGNIADAVIKLRRAVEIRPQGANYHTNLAVAYQEKGNLDDAIVHFNRALELDSHSPESQWNLSLALLKSGHYSQAWPLFESRLFRGQWRANYPHRLPQPRWQGQPFKGQHLLVHFEQGFGDTIQFMRYLPRVKAFGGQVTLEVPRSLLPLAKNMSGVDQAIEFNPEKPANAGADLHVPLMSLAGLFDTRLDTVPWEGSYIHPLPDRNQRWRLLTSSDALKVGLVWAGKDTDPLRTCKLEDLAPLLAVEGIEWVGLQKGRAADVALDRTDNMRLKNLGPELADFGDTAAVIQHLDLVVSVDTAAAHLAGAMEKPVFCFLRFCADWRWMAEGNLTPWYPSMRLFRQEQPGDWSAPVKAIAAAVAEMRDRSRSLIASHGGPAASAQSTAAIGNRAASGQALFQQALKYSAAGETTAAIAAYRKFLKADPDHALALFNLALCLRKSGDLAAARQVYECAIERDPNFIDAIYNLANLHLSQDHFPEAIFLYERVMELEPAHKDAVLNLSVALSACREDAAAQERIEAALRRWPDSAALLHQMGRLYSRQGAWTEAVDRFKEAVERAPESLPYRYNLGHALFQMGSFTAAAASFQEVLSRDPLHVAAKFNLGNTFKESGDLERAEAFTLEALEAEPGRADIRWNLAVIRLMKGEYAKAWPDFEARWEKPSWHACYPYKRKLPRWQGQPLAGKTLLVHDEQGFGDVLQFARYLLLLKPLGGRILFETRKPLIDLCAANDLADEVILRPQHSDIPVPCDYMVPLMSLPGIFGHTIDEIPSETPYLMPPKASVARWAGKLPVDRPKVGLVWSGRPTRAEEAPGLRGRSCGLAVLKPLIKAHPEIYFVGLQQGPATNEILSLEMAMPNLGPDFGDFADTAGAIAHLDLVITVDTAVAHLAGAMGKPMWILLQQVGDWRWLLGRSDSPWYPSARLFRQTVPGDWTSVVNQLEGLLSAGIAQL